MADFREAQALIATGKKKVGKTYQTLMELNTYIERTGRKVLFFDVNNEYGDVKNDHNQSFRHIRAIAIEDIPKWTLNGLVEMRRVLPINSKGQPLSTSELQQVMAYVLENFKNGCLVLEDLTKIVSDSIGSALIGSMATQRHASVDIYIHFQTIQKIVNPKLWGLSSVFRIHKTEDAVERYASKMQGDPEGLFISENLVDIINEDNGNYRGYVYYHKETRKIMSPMFNRSQFVRAIEKFFEDNTTWYKRQLNRIDPKTGKKRYRSAKECYDTLMRQYMDEFYGNPN